MTSGDVLTRAEDAISWWRSAGDGSTSSILGTGAVERLEQEAAQRLGHRLGVALPSGTLALRAALDALGVSAGDEVIVPAVDWGAASAAARSLGAEAVFAAVRPPALGISPTDVARRVTPRTRAVVVTHLFGVAADTGAVRALLPEAVAVVEDCAQAFGARRDDRPVGALGDLAICSFGPGKLVDAGEGGLVATSNPELHRRMVMATQHPAGQVLRGIATPDLANLTTRIHPVAAVMACHALETMDDELEARASGRQELAARIVRVCPDTVLSPWGPESTGVALPALLSAPDRQIPALSEAGVASRPLPGLHGTCRRGPEIAALAAPEVPEGHLVQLALERHGKDADG